MKGLLISLGKEPPKSKSTADDDDTDGPDEYDALARGILKAVKADDQDALASLLRECGLFGDADTDEDDY